MANRRGILRGEVLRSVVAISDTAPMDHLSRSDKATNMPEDEPDHIFDAPSGMSRHEGCVRVLFGILEMEVTL